MHHEHIPRDLICMAPKTTKNIMQTTKNIMQTTKNIMQTTKNIM